MSLLQSSTKPFSFSELFRHDNHWWGVMGLSLFQGGQEVNGGKVAEGLLGRGESVTTDPRHYQYF